jgi:hypothetical protein
LDVGTNLLLSVLSGRMWRVDVEVQRVAEGVQGLCSWRPFWKWDLEYDKHQGDSLIIERVRKR